MSLPEPHPLVSPPTRPLINGPVHFIGPDATKNYALLNTDEMNLRPNIFPPSSFFYLALLPITATRWKFLTFENDIKKRRRQFRT